MPLFCVSHAMTGTDMKVGAGLGWPARKQSHDSWQSLLRALRKHPTNIWESLWNLTCFQLYFVRDMNAPHFIKDFYLFILLTGITRFDLLGDFGRFNWLGNFYIVLSYNLLFAIVTTLCLVRKFTSAVREELFKALGNLEVYGRFFC